MTLPLVVLRPMPEGEATAQKARAMGLNVRCHPLFRIEPVSWLPPSLVDFDALMLTSANAIHYAGAGLLALRDLPVAAIGEATAQAARDAGLTVKLVGNGGAQELFDAASVRGWKRFLRLTGEQRTRVSHQDAVLTELIVYRAEAADVALELPEPSVLLVHSVKASARLADLVSETRRSMHHVIAISEKAAAASGNGWASISCPSLPQDDSMLALAAKLCK